MGQGSGREDQMNQGDRDRAGRERESDRARRANDAGDRPERRAGRNPAEWTTFAISLVVTAAVAGVALVEHFLAEEPPGVRVAVTVVVDRAERRDDRYYVPFTVANTGAAPATDVALVFEVRRGEIVLEESTADVPFLPVRGSEAGELVTALDPAIHQIVARVGSFQDP